MQSMVVAVMLVLMSFSYCRSMNLWLSFPWYAPKDYYLICILYFQVFHGFYLSLISSLDLLIKKYSPSFAYFPPGYYIFCCIFL